MTFYYWNLCVERRPFFLRPCIDFHTVQDDDSASRMKEKYKLKHTERKEIELMQLPERLPEEVEDMIMYLLEMQR